MNQDTTFSIHSNASDRAMSFHSVDDDSFTVEITGFSLQATKQVYAPEGTRGLADLFARLAARERPWMGDELWESIEGDFVLAARCSPLGIVTFRVHLHGSIGTAEDWEVDVSLTTELGQLPSLSARANRLFG